MSLSDSSLEELEMAAEEVSNTRVLFPTSGNVESDRERSLVGSKKGGTVDPSPRAHGGGTVEARPRAPLKGGTVELSSRHRLGSMPCQTQGSVGKGLPAPSRKRQCSPTPSDSRFHLTPSSSADLSSRSVSAPRGRAKVKRSRPAQTLVPSFALPSDLLKKKKKSAAVSAGPPFNSSADGQPSQLLKLLQSTFEHCGLLPPGSSASADGATNRADQADIGHPTPRGASSDSYESPALEPTQASPVSIQARPTSGVRPRESGHGPHHRSSLSRAPAPSGLRPVRRRGLVPPSGGGTGVIGG
nr:sialidase-like [Lytechinus pictus]